MQTNTIYCKNKCCKIEYIDYDESVTKGFQYNFYMNKKAGVCIYNSIRGSLLIVQSRGKLWGFPKGTVEQNEEAFGCALREVKEETNITLHPEDLNEYVVIKNKSVYYFYNTLYEIGSIPENAGTTENDVTGLSWIKIDCLYDLVTRNIIKLNYHTKYILKNSLNLNCC
jgi:8-oxo-dGTP pyrophosphatase MutT (NUDIX family)